MVYLLIPFSSLIFRFSRWLNKERIAFVVLLVLLVLADFVSSSAVTLESGYWVYFYSCLSKLSIDFDLLGRSYSIPSLVILTSFCYRHYLMVGRVDRYVAYSMLLVIALIAFLCIDDYLVDCYDGVLWLAAYPLSPNGAFPPTATLHIIRNKSCKVSADNPSYSVVFIIYNQLDTPVTLKLSTTLLFKRGVHSWFIDELVAQIVQLCRERSFVDGIYLSSGPGLNPETIYLIGPDAANDTRLRAALKKSGVCKEVLRRSDVAP